MIHPTFRVVLDHNEFFDKYDLDIFLPLPPEHPDPSPFEIAWKRVSDFFRKMWNLIRFGHVETEFKLTERQIKLIKQVKASKEEYKVKAEPSLSNTYKEPAKVQREPGSKPYIPSYPEEKTLGDFCEFLENFSDVLVRKCVYNEQISPQIGDWKKTAAMQVDQIKSTVDLIVNLKNSAAPFFKQLGALDDPALTIMAQQLLQIILQPLANEQNASRALELSLIKRIKELKENNEITEEQSLKISDYIKPTLRWLLNSSNWLISSPHPIQLHNFMADSLNFFDSFSSLNKQGLLDSQLAEIKHLIDKKIFDDIPQMLKLNTKPIANIISNRLSSLIANMPFKESFNNLLTLVIQQMDGYIEAEAKRKQLAALIANAKHDLQLIPKSQADVLIQQAAKKIVDKVKEKGGEEHYLDAKFHKTFAKHEACHPQINKLIHAETKQTTQKVRDEIFDHIIDEIIPCILPPGQAEMPDGSQLEVSGVAKFFDAVQYTENFDELTLLADKMIDTILDAGKFNDKDNFKKYYKSLKDVILTQFVNNKLKEQIKDSLESFFDKFTLKSVLDEMIGEHILPSLLKMILGASVRASLDENTSKLASIFHKFLDPENNFNLCMLELKETLYQIMEARKVDFNMEEAGISKDTFEEIVDPLCLEIINNLHKVLKTDQPEQQLTDLKVEGALKEYLKSETVPVNPLYSDLILKSLFKIGKFELPLMSSWTESILNWFKQSIAEQATASLYEISTTYHPSISAVVKTGNQYFLEPSTLKNIFFPIEISPEEKEEKKVKSQKMLSAGFRRISELGHDVVYNTLQSWTFGSIIKKFTPESKMLQETISSVYNRVFESQLVNQNLLVKIFDIFKKSFKEAVYKSEPPTLLEKNAQLLKNNSSPLFDD